MLKINRKFKIYFLFVLISLNFIAWTVVFDLSSNELEVVFLDVGQGDAIFIETPSNHQILIDGGPNMKVLEGLGNNMLFYDRTIDLIILTHQDHDHIGGLIEVLKNYEVESILWTGVLKDDAENEELKNIVKEKEVNVFVAELGQKILSGKSFVMDVVHPFESFENKTVKDFNSTSIINRIFFGDHVFLFTGDASKKIEKQLIDRFDLKANVLKLGHHGSKTSTDKSFVQSVNPDIAIISCGKDNRYDHPHPEVVEILNEYGINILRTDQLGDIKIVSDGKRLSIITH